MRIPVAGIERWLRHVSVSAGGQIFGFKFGDMPYLLETLAKRPPIVDAWAEALVRIKLKEGQR